MKLTLGTQEIDLTQPVVMTIINVTPDSFFDGSRTATADLILQRAEKAVTEGAALLDVGGYSSRPGAEDVSPEQEWERLRLALEVIRTRFPEIPLSIDTFRAEVMEQVLQYIGPCIANDITAAQVDPRMAEVAARHDIPLIAMHMRGKPQNMQRMTDYEDLIGEIHDYFTERIGTLQRAGVRQMVLDPGFGFSKTVEQNFLLLQQMKRLFGDFPFPVLAGISRKSMIYKTLHTTPADALTGTTALHWECLRQGASILRVHDTREAVQVVSLYQQFMNCNR